MAGCSTPLQLSPPSVSMTSAADTLGSASLPGLCGHALERAHDRARAEGKTLEHLAHDRDRGALGGLDHGLRREVAGQEVRRAGRTAIRSATSSLIGAINDWPSACSTTSQKVTSSRSTPRPTPHRQANGSAPMHSIRDADASSRYITTRSLVCTSTAAVPQTLLMQVLRASIVPPARIASQGCP